MEDKKKIAISFVQRHSVGVLATTTSNGDPEAAAVEFGCTDEGILIFDTFIQYRKYSNLKSNNHIAFVMYSDTATVQYEGTAYELVDSVEREKYQSIYFKQVPAAVRFVKEKDTRFFKVVPQWMRYRDYATNPETYFEITL